MKKAVLGFGMGLFLFFLGVEPASAIPAFSRKYQVSCTLCHAPAPRLNRYGELFAARGYRMEESKEPAGQSQEFGDSLLRLAKDFPISLDLHGYASYMNTAYDQSYYGEKHTSHVELEWPTKATLLSAGPIGEGISYYLAYASSSTSRGTHSDEGVRDAYLAFQSAFGLPMDVKIGRFRVSDQLFKSSLQLESTSYFIYSDSSANLLLSTDDGLIASMHLPGEIEASAGVFNGSSPNKDYTVRLLRWFGAVRLGLFSARGDHRGSAYVFGTSGYSFFTNRTRIWGPDASADIGGHVHLNLQYLEIRDSAATEFIFSDYYSSALGKDITTRGGFAELTWLPAGPEGRWAFTLLYNHVKRSAPASIVPADVTAGLFRKENKSFSLAMNFLLARNIRVTAEWQNGLNIKESGGSIGLRAAF
jgi:hypothetical protein